MRALEIMSRKHALEIFRGPLPPQRSGEVQGRKMSSVRREHDSQSVHWMKRNAASGLFAKPSRVSDDFYVYCHIPLRNDEGGRCRVNPADRFEQLQ